MNQVVYNRKGILSSLCAPVSKNSKSVQFTKLFHLVNILSNLPIWLFMLINFPIDQDDWESDECQLKMWSRCQLGAG